MKKRRKVGSQGREGGMMAKRGGLDAVSRVMKQAWQGVE